MTITPAAHGQSSVALKVSQRVARLQDQVDRVDAKLQSSPTNPGQLQKAQKLATDLADDQLLSHPKFSGNSMIYTALASPNLTFGQALKHPASAPTPPAPQDPPTAPPPDTTTGTIIDTTA